MNARLWIFPIATAVLVTACAEKAPPQAMPRLVKTLIVGATESAGARRYSGEVRARYESLLGFRIGGKIVTRLVDAGMQVRAGQPLARLDPSDAALQATQADAQRALADAELRRYRDLRERNFISSSALDAKETAFKAADAQAGLARNQANYTVLTADHDGVIASTLAEPGQVVAAGQTVVKLAQAGEREVSIFLPEDAVAGLKPGADAEVILWTSADKPLKGRLRELSPAADPATRLYAARVSLLNPPAGLSLGMSADVRFTSATAPSLVVPLTALIQANEGASVWVVDKDNKANPRPVKVQRFTDEGAVIAAGLSPGDVIVAAGAHKLHAGEPVRLTEPATR